MVSITLKLQNFRGISVSYVVWSETFNSRCYWIIVCRFWCLIRETFQWKLKGWWSSCSSKYTGASICTKTCRQIPLSEYSYYF